MPPKKVVAIPQEVAVAPDVAEADSKKSKPKGKRVNPNSRRKRTITTELTKILLPVHKTMKATHPDAKNCYSKSVVGELTQLGAFFAEQLAELAVAHCRDGTRNQRVGVKNLTFAVNTFLPPELKKNSLSWKYPDMKVPKKKVPKADAKEPQQREAKVPGRKKKVAEAKEDVDMQPVEQKTEQKAELPMDTASAKKAKKIANGHVDLAVKAVAKALAKPVAKPVAKQSTANTPVAALDATPVAVTSVPVAVPDSLAPKKAVKPAAPASKKKA